MRYSNILTKNHQLSISNPSCLVKFNPLNVQEGFDGPSNLLQDYIYVLDLDCVERNSAFEQMRNRNSSMDCTFVIHDESISSSQVVLVELRYNYVNMQNLTRKKLVEKEIWSKLAVGISPPIYPDSIFVFHKDLKEQARSRLFRMLPKVPTTFIVMDIYELRDLFFV